MPMVTRTPSRSRSEKAFIVAIGILVFTLFLFVFYLNFS